MTSTGICTGIENISKPTSRVMAPPGGKTNFSLGGYGEDPAPAPRKQTAAEVDADRQRADAQAKQDLYKPTPPQAIRPAEDSYANVFGVWNKSHDLVQGDNQPRGKRRYPEQTDLGHNPVTGADPAGGSDAAPQGDSGLTRGQRAKPAKIDPASMPAAGGRVGTRPPNITNPPGGRGSGIF